MNDFEALGAQFRQARETQELSLQDVEKRTRIRLKYLQAIEYGHLHLLDTPMQQRAFLRKYAETLSLDPEAILAQFDEARQGKRRRRSKSATAPTPAPTTSPDDLYYTRPRRNPLRIILTVTLALMLAAIVVGGLVVTINDLMTDPATPVPGGEIQSLVVDESTAVPTELTPPTPAPTLFLDPTQGLFLNLTAEQRLWARVTVDGVVEFEGVMRPGDFLTISANDSITVKTTNAAGLALIINNQPYRLGTSRQAAEQTFTVGGLLSPTPGPISQATQALTPTVTLTSRPSVTATITNTASPVTQTSPSPATFLFQGTTSVPSPTSLPTVGFSTDTPTPSPSPIPPTPTPSFTPSPLLPPRETRTPSDK